MTDLVQRLEHLGLSQYLAALSTEGFDTWETVLDITESDLTYLNFKLGHRRKLQRAIAEFRGQAPDRALALESRKIVSIEGGDRSDESGADPRDGASRVSVGSNAGAGAAGAPVGTKRKYRRHPKPDNNAPERPPSAYVIFSNQVREELKGQELSFTEIAKVVGERWQVLSANIRETCEHQANTAKERYYAELAEYKKTTEYMQYQEYLVKFKAKHGPSRSEGKRSKLETEPSSLSTQASSSRDSIDDVAKSRSAPLSATPSVRNSRSSPPLVGGLPGHSTFRRLSASASPALYSDSIHSPIKPDPYSPGANSPASSTFITRDARGTSRPLLADPRLRDSGPTTAHWQGPHTMHAPYRTNDNWPESGPILPGQQATLPRRSSRDSSSIPPSLTHQDSTISSNESTTPSSRPSGSLPPVADGPKSGRTLPHPIIASAPNRNLPLDSRAQGHLPPVNSNPGQDSSRVSNWPALLRASELAREVDLRRSDGPENPHDDAA